jgi:FMN-dependent oxidoreductase (nitrilotriacetate monooxygenase family)
MDEAPGQMILSAALMHGVGMHNGAWMARSGEASDYVSPDLYLDIARTAEAGKLHAVFLAEQITNQEMGVERPAGTLDTATVLALMAAATERVGLVGTASTTYNQPYDVARRFATLDHLSRGRAGWNSVATQNPTVVDVYGGGEHPDHEERYARADEFLEIVTQLWRTWDADAYVGDKAAGVFADEDKVHPINFAGRYFSVKGTMPFPRTPQGGPVIFQAGSSERGRVQAAQYADCVFTAQHVIEDAVAFRTDMRRRVTELGRHPDSIKVLPGMSMVLGGTEAEAWERKRRLDDLLGTGPNLVKLARRTGVPLESLDLDKPFPVDQLGRDEDFKGSIGFRRSIVSLAVKENLTVRELLVSYGGGHHHVIGTPEQVADVMTERLRAGAADGFTLMIDMLPEGVHDAVEMLVPVLRERGLFHDDYEFATLRDNLGLRASALAGVA